MLKTLFQIGGNRLLSLHRVQLAHRKVERLQSVFIGNSRPQSEAWEEQQKANSREAFSSCLPLTLSLSLAFKLVVEAGTSVQCAQKQVEKQGSTVTLYRPQSQYNASKLVYARRLKLALHPLFFPPLHTF